MANIIKTYEERLREAMIGHDCNELDRLESDELKFVNHMGQMITKQNDIEAHKNAVFNIKSITFKSQDIQEYSDVAIVISNACLTLDTPSGEVSDNLIYTRIWKKENDSYVLVAGQATQIK